MEILGLQVLHQPPLQPLFHGQEVMWWVRREMNEIVRALVDWGMTLKGEELINYG